MLRAKQLPMVKMVWPDAILKLGFSSGQTSPANSWAITGQRAFGLRAFSWRASEKGMTRPRVMQHHRLNPRRLSRRFGAGRCARYSASASTSRAMKAAPRSSWETSRYSSGWWAWTMEPGPQITVEKPASWNWPASAA